MSVCFEVGWIERMRIVVAQNQAETLFRGPSWSHLAILAILRHARGERGIT